MSLSPVTLDTIRTFFLLVLFGVLALFSKHLSAQSMREESQTRMEIIGLLQKWPRDFNAKNVQEVCGLFAHDVIASYPGTKDRNYADLCRQLSEAMLSTNKTFAYLPPEIEQVILEGNIAVVRLTWTLNVSSKDNPNIEVVKEKGLDVFQRQPDGSWKIVISYAYPVNH